MIPDALRAMLTPRALAAWAGTDRLSALARCVPGEPPRTPAARLFALLVGGQALPEDACPPVDERLLERASDGVRARWAVLPLGRSLLVCDRLDAEHGLRELVCWPDDSSYHLAGAIPPGRRARWLDVGCGSGFAPLLRPELAGAILGVDLNPRAVELARLGASLSEHRHLHMAHGDLTAGVTGTFELVTCNAPIPAEVGPLWRATADRTLFARLLAAAPTLLAPGGMLVLHAALDAVRALVEELPGERVVVSYTPGHARAFGVVWWRPDAAPCLVSACRPLTAEHPHLTHADRLAARDGILGATPDRR